MRDRLDRAGASAWALVFCVFAGLVLFGATRVPLGDLRLEVRGLFAALVLAVSGVVLLSLPRERRPGAGWVALVLAFPAWLLLQQIPLPAGWLAALDPAKISLLREVWPGPISACDTSVLLAADPAAWNTLTLDPASTRGLMFRVAAAGLAFLAARAYFGGHRSRRESLMFAVALFAGAEAAYGLFQWMSGATQVLWFEKTSYLDSATGTLINRNHFAMLLYLGLGCSLSLLVRDSRAQREHSGWDGTVAERLLASHTTLTLLVALQLAGVLASKSRAGLAGSLLVLIPCLPALLRGHRVARVVGWLVLALVALPAVLLAGPPLLDRLSRLPLEWTSEGGRGAVFRLMLDVASGTPVFGTGGGTFEWMFMIHRPEQIKGQYDFAHNDYLQVLVETGAVGLLLLLVPVGAFFVETLRRRRHEPGPDRQDWPLLLALAAVALHEIVDFGLQLPAPMVYAAILAGAVARPPRRPEGRAIAATAAGVAGLILAVPALLFGIASWPGLSAVLSPLQPPEAHHARARDVARAEAATDEVLPGAAACRAVREEARAQAERPLSAYYALALGSYTLRALREGAFESAEGDGGGREQVERQLVVARRLDRWNPLVRERLMLLSLSIGDLPAALQDALVAGGDDGIRAERVMDKLLDAGLPLSVIGPALSEEPLLLEEILKRALNSEADRPLAEKLVPPDVEADMGSCRVGWRVAGAYRRLYDASAEEFLRGCLEIAKRLGSDHLRSETVTIWLGADMIATDRFAAAAELLEELPPSRGRCHHLLRAQHRLGRWEPLTRTARVCLDEIRGRADPRARARWYAWLGEAYVRRDRRTLAIDAFEHAVALNPGSRHYRRILASLERGEDPFED
jgi:O-antigen ligase